MGPARARCGPTGATGEGEGACGAASPAGALPGRCQPPAGVLAPWGLTALPTEPEARGRLVAAMRRAALARRLPRVLWHPILRWAFERAGGDPRVAADVLGVTEMSAREWRQEMKETGR